MAWPTSTIDTSNMDAGTDDASQARAEIKKMADNVNSIKDAKGAADGVAPLGSDGKLPTANLPTVPVANGGTGQTSFSVGDILVATAAGVLSKIAPGTNGYVLKSNGAGNAPSYQAEGGGFPSGTRMAFQQSSAPTGWTKETNSAYNDVAMRIVTGTVSNGGVDDFTTVFGASKNTDNHTLTIAEIPSHHHTYTSPLSGAGPSGTSLGGTTSGSANTGNTGGGGGHSHGLTMDLKYRDFIIATKD